MAQLPIDIEKVVREVLAEMAQAQPEQTQPGQADSPLPVGEGQGVKASPAPPSPRPATGAAGGDLVLVGRVIALSDLPAGLAGVRRLIVPADAIVTPAVRDELLRKNIDLVFGQASQPAPRPALRLATFATSTPFDPSGLIRALQAEGIEVRLQTLDCLVATVDALLVELAQAQTLGLVLTRHTAAALCLANRVRGIRAIWGIDAGRVGRDAATVGANVLVADPSALGFSALKQTVLQFTRPGPRACPQGFSNRLG